MNPKVCRVCKVKYTPQRPLQSVCTPQCAIKKAEQDRINKHAKESTRKRVEHRKEKEQAKTRAQWMKEAQAVFNAARRIEDGISRGGVCISCGTKSGKQNCGHYRSVGSCPELRFEPLNTYLQCEKCNSYLSGNLINYRINLVKLIGIERVEWLEGPHDPKKYTIDDLKAIKSQYKAKLKELNEKAPPLLQTMPL